MIWLYSENENRCFCGSHRKSEWTFDTGCPADWTLLANWKYCPTVLVKEVWKYGLCLSTLTAAYSMELFFSEPCDINDITLPTYRQLNSTFLGNRLWGAAANSNFTTIVPTCKEMNASYGIWCIASRDCTGKMKQHLKADPGHRSGWSWWLWALVINIKGTYVHNMVIQAKFEEE